MPAPLKVRLTEQDDKQLLEVKNHPEIAKRVKERAEIIRLNAYGWSVRKIAEYMNKSEHAVRNSIHRWISGGIEGLWEKPGRGRKARWQPEDIGYLEECLEKEQRTYSAKQLAEKLKTERNIELSADRIRKILKKKDGGEKGRGHNSKTVQLLSLKQRKRRI